MKKYFEVIENPMKITHLKVEIYYSLGGMNYLTAKKGTRGYYLSVSPVALNEYDGYKTEAYSAFSGIKQLIKPVSRRSLKAETEAEKLAENIMENLIQRVLDKNNLKLAV